MYADAPAGDIGMTQLARMSERRTIVDDIYDHLHAEI